MKHLCNLCGQEHQFKCPLIKAYDYYEDGRVKRVEFVTFADLVKTPTQDFSGLPAHPTRQ